MGETGRCQRAGEMANRLGEDPEHLPSLTIYTSALISGALSLGTHDPPVPAHSGSKNFEDWGQTLLLRPFSTLEDGILQNKRGKNREFPVSLGEKNSFYSIRGYPAYSPRSPDATLKGNRATWAQTRRRNGNWAQVSLSK